MSDEDKRLRSEINIRQAALSARLGTSPFDMTPEDWAIAESIEDELYHIKQALIALNYHKG